MTGTGHQTIERENLLYDRLIACLEAEGEARQALRTPIEAEFPDFADELREFFDGHELIERIATPLRLASPSKSSTVWGDRHHESASTAAPPSLSEYELVREIAHGGMGIVYEARHRMLGRSVALKMIKAGERASEDDVRRFREEARRVAQLDHADIVPLYEAGHEGGQHYFTMRLMEGGSLAERIASAGLTSRQAAEVIARIARALHFAHQRGILHRDVKPANILFDLEGHPHVGDFGLASPLEPGAAISRLDAVAGTPMYMAPELVKRDGELTTAVDVYGLGAVLYELLVGRPPFRAGSLLETLSDLASRDPERPRAIAPALAADLEAVCLKCLDKNPGRRYGSAEALADDLDRWLRDEAVEARPCPPWSRVAKWARRSPVVAALTALSIVASLACVAALWISNVIVSRETRAKSYALDEQSKAYAALLQLREQEQHVSYLQGIALADRELQSGSAARALRLLGELPPALRGPEWNYLLRLSHAERRSLAAPGEPACIALHPQRGEIYVGGGLLGRLGEVALYDAGLERKLSKLSFGGRVTALALSPDGHRLVIAVRGRGVRVCDAANGKEIVAFDRREGDVWAVAFSPDGKRVASGGSDDVARIWDAATGREIVSIREAGGAVWSIALSPDGRRVATGSSEGNVGIWDAESGRRLVPVAGHRALVRSVAFSPDGKRLVSAGYDNTARVSDAATGAELAALTGHTAFVTRASFSPDGRRIATAGVDGTVRIWDASDGQQVLLLRGHQSAVWDVAFSGDGANVTSVGQDGTVKFWAATPHGMPRLLDPVERRVRRIKASTDGRVLIVLFEDGKMEAWSTETDHRLYQLGDSYNKDSRNVVSGDGSRLTVWPDSRTIRAVRIADATTVCDFAVGPTSDSGHVLAYDGSALAVAQSDRVIGIWDEGRREAVARIEQPQGELLQLAVSPKARVLAATIAPAEGETGRVYLWRRGTHESLVEIASGSRIALSPRGDQVAVFGDSGVVTVWDTATAEAAYRLDGMAGTVRAVAFAGQGRLLTGDDHGTVTIWDTRTRREVLSLRDMTAPVDFLAIRKDGAVLGASRDGSVRRWEAGPVAGRASDGEGQRATLSKEQER
jgi:eukaryotic-like serine/threonine-protein kinase